ncbi:type II secretion system F family protein [Nocardioides sp. NPDC004968]|uniref:type II secretion system F family protein n=1 Tax=Nocardioides sp. NPDC004968 TaxID=3155894 RepID=UPI00339E4712
MTTQLLIAALCGGLIAGGIAKLIGELRGVEVPDEPRRHLLRLPHFSRRTRLLLVTGIAVGVLGWFLTGWPLALVIAPAAIVGLPYLLSAPDAKERIEVLEALDEWTRSLSGVLTVGLGLEQALITTSRSTPAPIAEEVGLLVARLRARWATEDAIRAFANDLDDATGDLVAGNLILAARRRGAGLAKVLDGLAESVAADVRARRQVEADRAKPRATARWVTIISTTVLVVLGLAGSYIEPYGSPLGQAILAVLLTAYVATLLWMRRMAGGRRLPRIIGPPGGNSPKPGRGNLTPVPGGRA